MDNKKVSNLLRAVADLMDQTTEVVVETNKNVIEKTITNSWSIIVVIFFECARQSLLSYSYKLGKKISCLISYGYA